MMEWCCGLGMSQVVFSQRSIRVIQSLRPLHRVSAGRNAHKGIHAFLVLVVVFVHEHPVWFGF